MLLTICAVSFSPGMVIERVPSVKLTLAISSAVPSVPTEILVVSTLAFPCLRTSVTT